MDEQPHNPYEPPAADLARRHDDRAGAYTASMVESLTKTRPWVRFLAILGFVGTALMFLGGLVFVFISLFVPSAQSGMGGAGMGALYAALGLFYGIVALQLHRYATAIAELGRTGEVASMEQALDRQYRFWRTVGIATVVILALYALAAIVGIIVAVVAAVI